MMNEADLLLKEYLLMPWVGIGYVIVPPDVQREDYIATCFASEKVSIYPEVGGMSYNDVPLSREVLQQIEFPEEGREFGSQVVYVLHPAKRYPIIIAVVDKQDECQAVSWKQFKLSKEYQDNSVSIVGDARQGVLLFNVTTSTGKGGQIQITVLNPEQKGKFELQVQGEILLVHDLFTLHNKTTRILSTEKIQLGVESDDVDYSPAVRGNELVDDVIKPLFDALKQLQVATGVGPSGTPLPTFIQSIDNIANKLDSILSKKVELE